MNNYSGLTIILSNPSRNDLENNELLSGSAGYYLFDQWLGIPREHCNIVLSDNLSSPSQLPNDTKAVFLLGEKAFHAWTKKGMYEAYLLQEQRGCPLEHNFGEHVTCIASFHPQDAMDVKDYERQFNPLLKDNNEEDDDAKDNEKEDVKHKGKTRRSNYRFWLARDCLRINHIIANERRYEEPKPLYITAPTVVELSEIANSYKDQEIFLDIETDRMFNVTVLSVGLHLDAGWTIYTIPITRYDYSLAYTPLDMVSIFRSLNKLLLNNTVVVHNATFDLFVLSWRYKFLFSNRIYDTMLAHHRAFVGAERSLGHAMSHLTWQPYHKDEGVFEPKSLTQEKNLWNYNAKDVYGMMLIKQSLDDYVRDKPGLRDSIVVGNRCIRPYIINSLTGISFDDAKRQARIRSNDIMMTGYLRAIDYLTGPEAKSYYATGSTKGMPASNKQMCKYFHDLLGYPVIKRSEKTNQPSLDEKALLSLKLKYPENPVIDFVLAYRGRAKETGTMNFTQWTGPNYHGALATLMEKV